MCKRSLSRVAFGRTIAEQGVKGFEDVFWYGVVAPAGLPPETMWHMFSESGFGTAPKTDTTPGSLLCWSAVKKLDAPPSQTAIVGDQVFADVMAGRVAGVRTILVDPIHPEEEPWFTRLKRWPERVVLARQEA